mmetsp:Transcript_22415/g.19343  ORF Transcript_22415/g.19343 Transcript_22415/m.19343 type:complete len:185 (+) Transcript_22415:148-702(+)
MGEKTTDVIDNFLQYSGEQDCNGEKDFTKNLESDMAEYLSKVAEGLVSEKLTNEEATIVNENQFSVFAQKLTECTIFLNKIETDTISPTLVLNRKDPISQQNCTKELLVSYYSFNEEIFDCDRNRSQPLSASDSKTIMILQIMDTETGEDLKDNYKVILSNPDGVEGCPDGCELVEEDSANCEC